MKLYFDKRLSDPTYYAQKGIRNGKKVSSVNVLKFGKHSELLKITDNPEKYCRDELIKMNEEHRVGKVSYNLTADFNERVKRTSDESSSSNWVNIGYFILQYVLKELNLKEFFRQITAERKISYDCYTISRFLTYARILDPASKYATWSKLANYFEQPDFDYQHIVRFMDILEEHHNEYLEWLFKNSNNVVKRNTSILYYDCTNFYCECDKADENVIDDITGECIEGLRKFGVSKDHKPNPIVQMGLFMDSNGIPVTMSIHPGNSSEQLTAIPLEEEVLKMIDGAKFIYCADAGIGSYSIRKFNSMGGRAFIVTQSIKKLSCQLQKAVFNDFDYRMLSDDKPVTIRQMKEFDKYQAQNLEFYNDCAYKVIVADKAVDLGLYEDKVFKNGRIRRVKSTGVLEQRVIVTFSRKMMEYQRKVRARQIEQARKLLDLKEPEEIKKGPHDVRRFLKRITSKENEAEVVNYILDDEKIANEEKYDGYYAVATNLQDRAQDILAVSRKRYQIEDCFRIMKTNFNGRPINHRLANRIRAHFLICYTALLVYRLLEVGLRSQGTPVTVTNVIDTLKNMNVINVHDIEYMALYKGSKALDALCKLTELDVDFMHYKPTDLNKKVKKLLK